MTTMRTSIRRMGICALSVFGVVAFVAPGKPAHAALIDTIEVDETRPGSGNESAPEIQVVFTVPVRYVHHFPAKDGRLLTIRFRIASTDAVNDILPGERLARTVSGPDDARIPRFTATTTVPDALRSTTPVLELVLQFEEPVEWEIRRGDDLRSFRFAVREVIGHADGARPSSTSPPKVAPK